MHQWIINPLPVPPLLRCAFQRCRCRGWPWIQHGLGEESLLKEDISAMSQTSNGNLDSIYYWELPVPIWCFRPLVWIQVYVYHARHILDTRISMVNLLSCLSCIKPSICAYYCLHILFLLIPSPLGWRYPTSHYCSNKMFSNNNQDAPTESDSDTSSTTTWTVSALYSVSRQVGAVTLDSECRNRKSYHGTFGSHTEYYPLSEKTVRRDD